jgi:uncharacterized protein (UPF0303 family)
MSVVELGQRPASKEIGEDKPRTRAKHEAFPKQALRMTLPRFNAETARSLGEIVANIASRRGLAMAVSVVRASGPLYFCALEGSCADHADSVRRKQNTVLHFGKSSWDMAMIFAREGWTLPSRGMSMDEFSLAGGGVPLYVANAGLVGAMAVSGLGSLADHRLALEALGWHVGMSPTEAASCFPAEGIDVPGAGS